MLKFAVIFSVILALAVMPLHEAEAFKVISIHHGVCDQNENLNTFDAKLNSY